MRYCLNEKRNYPQFSWGGIPFLYFFDVGTADKYSSGLYMIFSLGKRIYNNVFYVKKFVAIEDKIIK